MGAIMADANEKDADALYQFGLNLGMAFQLQDDMLDTFGDEAVFGKKIGGDILCNKKTFLLIKAQELAKGDAKIELERWIGEGEFNPEEKIAAVRKIYEDLNVRDLAELQIDRYFNLCQDYLASVKVDEKKKENLSLLVKRLINRSV